MEDRYKKVLNYYLKFIEDKDEALQFAKRDLTIKILCACDTVKDLEIQLVILRKRRELIDKEIREIEDRIQEACLNIEEYMGDLQVVEKALEEKKYE